MDMKEKLINLVKEMIAVEYCDSDLVTAGQAWLDSNDDSDAVKAAAANLIVELEQCIVPIDDAIALAKSFPEDEFWKGVLETELKAKEDGMTICGCVACINGQMNRPMLFLRHVMQNYLPPRAFLLYNDVWVINRLCEQECVHETLIYHQSRGLQSKRGA